MSVNNNELVSLRLKVATELLAGTDVVGSSTNNVNAKITTALQIAEALIIANHEMAIPRLKTRQDESEAINRVLGKS